MGLFATKKKRFVDTQITRVIDDDQLPTPLETAVFESIIDQDGDIGVSVKNAALNGPGRNFDRMYRYAERGDYFFGLPDARLLSTEDGEIEARKVIEQTIEGRPVDIDYVRFRPVNNNHMAWKYLHEELEYDPSTNEITVLTPFNFGPDEEREPRYLTKIVVVHNADSDPDLPFEKIDPQALGIWGSNGAPNISFAPATVSGEGIDTIQDINAGDATSPYIYDYRVGPDEIESAEIHYAWESKDITYADDGTILNIDRTLRTGKTIVDLSGFDPNKEIYQAKYSYMEGDQRVQKFWNYDPIEEKHPQLDAVFESRAPGERGAGSYFPFAIFRSEQENRSVDDGSEQFNTTKKLLDYINIDFEEMGEAMHDEGNDGIDDLRQAVMVMAVPLNSQHPIEMDYLFDYFKDLSEQVREKDPDGDLPSAEELMGRTGGAKETSYALEIADADFSMIISFDQIKRRVVIPREALGPVGTIQNETTELSTDELGNIPFDSDDVEYTAVPKRRYIRKQVLPSVDGSPGLVEEIMIDNPVFKFPVKELRKKTLTVEGGVDDERLLIPLERRISSEMTIFDRQILYFRSLHFVMNSYVEQKVKWWQTGIFKAILVIVAVAVAWVTGGWSVALLAATSFAAAAMVILSFIVTFLFSSLLIDYAFKFVVDLIGVDAAFWIALAATMVGGYKAMGSLAQGAKTVSQTAMNYLKVAAGLHSGISGNIAEGMESLRIEQQAFVKEAEEKQEELDEMARMLKSPVDIDPLFFVRKSEPFVIFGEPVSAYYARTAHSGNVGAMSLDIVQNYVDYSLQLPKTTNFGD